MPIWKEKSPKLGFRVSKLTDKKKSPYWGFSLAQRTKKQEFPLQTFLVIPSKMPFLEDKILSYTP